MAQGATIESKGRKRNGRVESLDEPLSTASVHGVISSLSPIKKGCKSNYFDGSVSDGKSKVRLVGFSPSQQTKMERKQAIKFDDCEVRHARRGQKMEILLKAQKLVRLPRSSTFRTL